jgi:putative NADH-flavin reductase
VRIAVVGSTGGTGRLILAEATRRRHEVTAFARHRDALADMTGLSGVVEGDGRDRAALERAVAGRQAVMMVVSGRGETDAVTGIARTLTEAMESLGVPRLVASSAYGMVAVRPYLLAPLVRRVFRDSFADQLRADRLIETSSLDWTIVRATRLTNRADGHAPRLSTELFTRGPYSLSRTAYASALLDLAEDHAHSREIVNITR